MKFGRNNSEISKEKDSEIRVGHKILFKQKFKTPDTSCIANVHCVNLEKCKK
jgi:hypothetical protein